MKTSLLATSALALVAADQAYSQATPPAAAPPFPGLINEALRSSNTNMCKWDFGGTFRTRFEAKEDMFVPGVPGAVDFRANGADNSNEYFLERLRYHAGYSEAWWGAFVEGQSSLVQGDERYAAVAPAPVPKKGDGPESDIVMLRQANVRVGDLSQFPLSLKAGRQELIYGEERLIGAFNWNNIGRVFDAAKVHWQNEVFAADFFTSRVVIPEDGRFNVANDYDWFSGVYATTAKIPKNSLDLYCLSRNASTQALAAEPSPQFAQPSARDIYTVGTRFKSKPGELGPWDYTGEFMGQFGHFNDPRPAVTYKSREQRAFATVVQGAYTFKSAFGAPRLGLEYVFASGDSDPTSKTHGTFDNLFPTNHRLYGTMDFVSLQNIHDAHAFYQMKLLPKLTLSLDGHNFWLASTSDSFYNIQGVPRAGGGYGINPSYGSYVGSELDLIASYALNRFTQLEAGYGHFFTGDYVTASLQKTGGAADANYFYLQVNLSY